MTDKEPWPGSPQGTDADWRSHQVAGHPSETVRAHRFGVWVQVVVCRTCNLAFITGVGKMPGVKAALQRRLKGLHERKVLR